ncbi:hypothetical protein Tco_0145576 [Tanacetum coccineum]
MLVRQAYTSTITDTKSKPLEDPIKTKEPQSLPITSAPIPSHDYTPATPLSDEESEAFETSETRITSPHFTTPSSDFTSPLSPNNPLSTQTSLTLTPYRAFYYRSTTRIAVRTHPTLSSSILARVTEVMTLSPLSFYKKYRSSYKTPSSLASPASSLALPSRKRYRGTSEPIVDTKTEEDELEAKGIDSESEESEDEGLGSRIEEATSEDQQQEAVPIEDTVADESFSLGYGAARRRSLELEERHGLVLMRYDRVPWRGPFINSDPILTSSDTIIAWVVPEPVLEAPNLPSPVATPVSVRPVNEGYLAELGAQIKLNKGILHNHTHRLDALPSTIFEGYGQNFIELFARSRAVRDEIHSQCFWLRILEQGQEQAMITFGALWRPVLALEAWAGHSGRPKSLTYEELIDHNHSTRGRVESLSGVDQTYIARTNMYFTKLSSFS